jgi:hypothetical protein
MNYKTGDKQMTKFLGNRIHKFSDEEFLALPRNEEGAILDLWDAYCFISRSQYQYLTYNDYWRMKNIDCGYAGETV